MITFEKLKVLIRDERWADKLRRITMSDKLDELDYN